jgi:hypothetical protein
MRPGTRNCGPIRITPEHNPRSRSELHRKIATSRPNEIARSPRSLVAPVADLAARTVCCCSEVRTFIMH